MKRTLAPNQHTTGACGFDFAHSEEDHQPVRSESRIAFGIQWYDSRQIADAVGATVVAHYAGYDWHRAPLGRAPEFDIKEGNRLYAVKVP